MIPPTIGMEELKRLLFNEVSTKKRAELCEHLLESSILSKDQYSLIDNLQFILDGNRKELNSEKNLRAIMNRLTAFFNGQEHVIVEMWPCVQKLVEFLQNMKLESHHASVSYNSLILLFSLIEKQGLSDVVDLTDIVDMIMNVHFSQGDVCFYGCGWDTGFSHLLNRVKSVETQMKIIERMLMKCDEQFELKSVSKEAHKFYSTLSAVKYGNRPSPDMSLYPKCVEVCRYLLTPREGQHPFFLTHESGRISRLAFDLIKDNLPQEELQRVPYQCFTTELVRKKLRARQSLMDNEFEWLLVNGTSNKGKLLYLLHKSVASDGNKTAAVVRKCMQHFEKQNGNEKSAASILAIFLKPEDFRKRFQGYYPTNSMIKVEEVASGYLDRQLAVAHAIRFVKDRKISLEMLSHFLHGRYLNNDAYTSLNVICRNSPKDLVLHFLESHVINSPVNVQKQIIRLIFRLAMKDAGNRLLGVIEGTKIDTIKLVILKQLYLQVVKYGQDIWPVLNRCLKTIQTEDRLTIQFIMKTHTIDKCLGSHISAFFRQLLVIAGHCSPKYIKTTLHMYKRAGEILHSLDEDLTLDMFETAVAWPLECDEVSAFAVKVVFTGITESRKSTLLTAISKPTW